MNRYFRWLIESILRWWVLLESLPLTTSDGPVPRTACHHSQTKEHCAPFYPPLQLHPLQNSIKTSFCCQFWLPSCMRCGRCQISVLSWSSHDAGSLQADSQSRGKRCQSTLLAEKLHFKMFFFLGNQPQHFRFFLPWFTQISRYTHFSTLICSFEASIPLSDVFQCKANNFFHAIQLQREMGTRSMFSRHSEDIF